VSRDDRHPGQIHDETLFSDMRQPGLDFAPPAAHDGAAAPAVAHPEIPDTWTEAWRRECEARHVMRLPLEARRTYYAGVREKRGEPAMAELVAEVNRQWAKANPL